MNTKQMGAIALTLIVCCPIALGFALATEETEVTGYQTTDQTRISDLLLNAKSPYYTDSTSSANNATLLQQIYYPSGGATETSSVTPSYVKAGKTYSSMPILSTLTQTFELSTATSATPKWYSAEGQGVVVGQSTYVTDGAKIAYSITADTNPAYGVIRVSYTTDYSAVHCTHYFQADDGTTTIRQTVISEMVFYTQQEGNLWTYYLASATGQHVSDLVGRAYTGYASLFDVSMTATIQTRAYSDVSSTPTSWTTTLTHPLIAYTDNGVQYKQAGASDGEWTLMRSGSTFTLIHGADSWTITSSDFKVTSATLGASFITLSSPGEITGYADTAYGWNLPNADKVVKSTWWYNYQNNSSVSMMLDLSAVNGSDLELLPATNLSIIDDPLLTISRSSGKVSVTAGGTATELGTYSHVTVKLSSDGWEVSGLSAWPTMGATASTLNTVKGSASVGDFTHVRMSGGAWDKIAFRVDTAAIQAGTFPSTKDFTFDVTDKFPSYTQAAMELTSIGVYGDTIRIGDSTYTVTVGRITVGETIVPLLGAVISAWPNGSSTYSYKINDVELPDCDDALNIFFGGEWSLTATLYNMTEVTQTKTTWAPGVFAFDEQDYVVASMLTAFGTFLVLTASGRASGAKAAFLAMICGGSVAVLLTII